MTAAAASDPAADLIRPFLKVAATAFAVGFLGVMALAGTGMLAQLGELPGQSDTLAAVQTAEPVASPAAASGVASEAWNLPKAI